MARYAVETRSTAPKNFFAGDFPTLTERGTAGEELKEHTPVVKGEDGKLKKIVKKEDGKPYGIAGITAEAAQENDPVVYYMTGEFFADALEMPEDVTADDIKEELRKLSIFLKDDNMPGKR